jgi:menaquinone-specific isochorismate synthase
LAEAKNLQEHRLAVRSVADVLAAHCTDLLTPGTPHVLRLANVQHLATDLSARLVDGTCSLELAGSLHPTAAVCGTPRDRARALIAELEGLDRGRYAGPVGWVDAAGDGEWGIALRCAEVAEERLRLFAGCGIVAGSDPDAELVESQAKLVAMRDALES